MFLQRPRVRFDGNEDFDLQIWDVLFQDKAALNMQPSVAPCKEGRIIKSLAVLEKNIGCVEFSLTV